jgi:hypothetical protein
MAAVAIPTTFLLIWPVKLQRDVDRALRVAVDDVGEEAAFGGLVNVRRLLGPARRRLPHRSHTNPAA